MDRPTIMKNRLEGIGVVFPISISQALTYRGIGKATVLIWKRQGLVLSNPITPRTLLFNKIERLKKLRRKYSSLQVILREKIKQLEAQYHS